MAGKGITFDAETARQPLGQVKQIIGGPDARDLIIGIVASRYNEGLTGQLVRTAVEGLKERGAREDHLTLVWVPGAFEIPAVINKLAATRRFDVLIAIGVVIQGETPHAGLINNQVAHSLAEISRHHDVPVIEGVVAVNNLEQARVRCSTERTGRGWYAAAAAVEMAQVFRQLETGES